MPWILDHGLQCSNSHCQNPSYVPIGDSKLISKRKYHAVPMPPGGTLGDYIPFYFTPRSPMLHKILTGRGVTQRSPHEIVIIGTNLARVAASGAAFIFTDGHAYGRTSSYFEHVSDLDRIDWELLQRSDFKADVEDPGKVNRYQAEALVHKSLRLDRLCALACYDDDVKEAVERWVKARGSEVKVFTRDMWFPL